MKFVKWKFLIITCLICLSPVLLGIALWDKLPDTLAIHFNINNEPDNFASKGFVVFGLPVLIVLLQAICCIAGDINARTHAVHRKFEQTAKWIIPIMSVILQIITLGYGLGWDIDIRKCAMLIIGVIFITLGNYMPKLDYINGCNFAGISFTALVGYVSKRGCTKNEGIGTDKARKINRFMGFGMVIMGILGLITIFLPTVSSVIWLILLIPYVAVSVIYTVKVTKNK